ncbi:protein-disulfide reductase DsbD family protein [Flavivirga aquimarina]|uniref:Protein-disulfide reductase DsbD family protein n=1 Tax=Flavivirga aquimarina TaxID=2027862 RepID=A0ABT8W7I0_9FLAO|nr:thioredoxin family protein [Flavivirga aquimarina]MDO5969039.1 protein-disulfide reductase DsbD family protein [Flavivirga aquimarina]
MKKLVLLLALFSLNMGNSQIFEPVKWITSVEKISNNKYKLISKASIESGWHLYSQDVPEDGPVPTTFTYDDKNGTFKIIGKTLEEEGHTIDDPIFGMKIKFFEDQAVFEQIVEVLADERTVNATVEFMVCDDTKCLPPTEVDLVFNLPSKSLSVPVKTEKNEPAKTKNASTSTNAQGILDPVKWDFQTKKIGDKEYELIFVANIDENWALYSQFIEGEGPIPTTFTFQENNDYILEGDVIESDKNKVTKKEPLFDNIKVGKFYNQAVFTQKVKIDNINTVIKGNLQYMACDDSKCIFPPEEPFLFNFTKLEIDVSTNKGFENNNSSVNNLLYGMSTEDLKRSEIECDNEAVNNASEVKNSSNSLWRIFGLGFLGGLLALLTPCVFPMIPLTVSFFTKKGGESKGAGISKALLYGFFIFAVYILLSVPFHLLDSVNPDILNEISTNIWLNVIFFVIFLFFAFSFFGYYELTLPSNWTNKTTQGENVGGLVGIFFMALTLALVSFSCTGPILGSLLAGSLTADGGAWQLTAGMAGFGVSLGLPFALFAMFPNMMNALPKSGGWLNTTKVILGFLELALAFKFLSNADLVAHWGILKIEPFLIIWIIVFGGLSLYLFGKIKFPHDSPIKKLSFSRISGGILVAAFTIYLVSGFRVNKDTKTFTPLTLLSGLAPPVGYSFLYPNDCPNNLNCFKDLKEGLAYAKKVNKPIMIDFTGLACVNCRKMEEHVWPLKKIDNYLRNDYVLISLYVDDKKELPEAEQVEVTRINGGTRTLKNYGHKWAHFQTQFFQTNSQPYYVLLSPNGKQILNQPVGYTPDENEYAKFLECGLKKE